MQIILPLTTGIVESPNLSTEDPEVVPTSSESSETVSDIVPSETTSEEVSDLISPETFMEEESELLPEELATEEIETVTEIVNESNYSREDLQNIETSLQVIACLLFVIVIWLVVKACRSILDILGF